MASRFKRLTKKDKEKLRELLHEAEALMGPGRYVEVYQEVGVPPIAQSKRRQYLRLLFDIVCGLYYGYPPCCVWFFSTHDAEEIIQLNQSRAKTNKHYWKTEYIPCERCYSLGQASIPWAQGMIFTTKG